MIRIGIICPSEIAFRRFMPAIMKQHNITYAGVAFASIEEWFDGEGINNSEAEKVLASEKEKAKKFVESYGGSIFAGYENMLRSDKIDAVYIPLPPALHYKWAKKALKYGLHVFLEKPFTVCQKETNDLLKIADENKLAVHENYMFIYHSQIREIDQIIQRGDIGEVRLYRLDFGFPKRSAGDFRYNKKLGGGALLDCGGYTLKYASFLLGESLKIDSANIFFNNEFDVEIFGTAALSNEKGVVVQIAFGMDNDYRCSIDAWGSRGTLTSNRILTAPDGYEPEYIICKNGECKIQKLSADSSFDKSISCFYNSIREENIRIENYKSIQIQSYLVELFKQKVHL